MRQHWLSRLERREAWLSRPTLFTCPYRCWNKCICSRDQFCGIPIDGRRHCLTLPGRRHFVLSSPFHCQPTPEGNAFYQLLMALRRVSTPVAHLTTGLILGLRNYRAPLKVYSAVQTNELNYNRCISCSFERSWASKGSGRSSQKSITIERNNVENRSTTIVLQPQTTSTGIVRQHGQHTRHGNRADWGRFHTHEMANNGGLSLGLLQR